MSTAIATITDTNFESQVLRAPQPVLLDYWARWCGPCKTMEPAVAQLAQQFADRLVVAKIDVDENQIAPARYGVRGIPTMMLFRDGAVVATRVGAMSAAQLASFVEGHL